MGSGSGVLRIVIIGAKDPAFYADLPGSAKAILTFFMLLGRLELFTVLVLLTPAFWRR